MKRTLFTFSMIAGSRDYINIHTRADELRAAVCRLQEIEIVECKRKELLFSDGTLQVRYEYTAKRKGTWKETFRAINAIKPVAFKII